jgi:hypothetical protein
MPSSKMQRTVGEMTKTQRELHNAIREKAAHELQLQSALGDLKDATDNGTKEQVATVQRNVEQCERANDACKAEVGTRFPGLSQQQ